MEDLWEGENVAPIEAGLSIPHIGPEGLETGSAGYFDEVPISATFKLHGVKFKWPTVPRAPKGGGTRGEVNGMSGSSRLRMMDLLTGIDFRQPVCLVTLTYPESYPDAKTAKDHLRAFLKRIARRKIFSASIWKLEYQERGAPHFHILCFGKKASNPLRKWISSAWYDVVNSGDEKHLRAGTECENIRKPDRILWYLGKYLGKEFSTTEKTGRCWGKEGKIPQIVASRLMFWRDVKEILVEYALDHGLEEYLFKSNRLIHHECGVVLFYRLCEKPDVPVEKITQNWRERWN